MNQGNSILRMIGRVASNTVRITGTLSPDISGSYASQDVINLSGVALPFASATFEVGSLSILKRVKVTEICTASNEIAPALRLVFLQGNTIPANNSAFSLGSDAVQLGHVDIANADYKMSYTKGSSKNQVASVAAGDLQMEAAYNSNTVYCAVLANASITLHSSHSFFIECFFERC